MSNIEQRLSHIGEGALTTNKVLRNTYLLLSMTLLFSAATAGVAMWLNIPQGAGLVLSLVAFGLLFWVHKVADTSQGLVAVFAFTGCLGAALGPMLNHYLGFANGPMLVMQALGGTALIFLTLSAYVVTTRKDFSFLGGFLLTGMIVVIVAMLLNIFLQIPVLSLTLSSAIILLMSGFILFDTSRIIHGGETNYIRATVGLYLSIYNLFTSLLHLLGAFSGDE
jgi:modulator of FtsH protease